MILTGLKEKTYQYDQKDREEQCVTRNIVSTALEGNREAQNKIEEVLRLGRYVEGGA